MYCLTREQLALWRGQGMTNIEISEKTGVSLSRVNNLFSIYKIPRRDRSIPEDKVQDMRRMADSGSSIAGIAQELGISPSTARRYLKGADPAPDKGRAAGCREAADGGEPGLPTVFAVQREPEIEENRKGGID